MHYVMLSLSPVLPVIANHVTLMTEMPGSTTESLWKQCTVPSQTVSGNTLSIRHFPSETDQTLTQNLGATFH